MAEDIELREPGIEILQVFADETPTIITPTLPPLISGVCKQIVEVLTTSASGGTEINSDARCTMPAWFEVSATSYTTLDGLNLGLSINNSPVISVTFSGVSLSNQAVVDTVNDALQDNNLNGYAYAEVLYDSSGDASGWRLRTRSAGDDQTIAVSAPATTDRPVLVAFSLPEDHVFSGADNYQGNRMTVPFFSYPDPRSNLDELSLDTTTPRFFLYMGTSTTMQEAEPDEALLCYGVVGGDGDVSAIAPQDDGDGDATTPIIRFTGEDFTVAGDAIVVTGTAAGAWTVGNINDYSITLDDGSGEQTYTFVGVAADADVITQLEAVFGSAVGGRLSFSQDVSDYLVITTDKKGADAYLKIAGDSTLLTELGLTAATHRADYSGRAATPALKPHAPLPGDDVYVNGAYKGRIVQVAPGGTATDLKLDTEHLVSTPSPVWSSYYIVARNLPNTSGAVRPDPDLQVGVDGSLAVKGRLIRDTTGASISTSNQMYAYYEALRLDVSVSASNPSLLSFDSDSDVEDLLDPISVDNPLALGLYFALLNSNNARVYGIGVDAISADQPYGTTAAYSRVFEFLESKEVYAIVPLTHDMTVAALGLTHVTTMSSYEYKGERICLFAAEFPARAPDTTIASGTNGNATGSSELYSTDISNIAQLVLAEDIVPTGTISVDEGLYLDVAGDDNHYSVKSISGGTLTLRYQSSDFTAGENDDSFYAEDYVPQTISGTFAVKKRGVLLVDTSNNPDKDAIADAYQDIAASFDSRRFWHHALNNVKATVDSVEQVLPGFYWCAAKAGAIAGQPPQQSFTNFPITGFSVVTGTNTYFSKRQMNRMAAGGNCIPVQEPPATGPIFERMSLTTDMTSVETRTDIITKVLDFGAKFCRRLLRIYIGRFNINQNYLDTLSNVLGGAKAFLTGTGVFVDMEINEIVQSEDEPDMVEIDTTIDPPYPCNYIRMRMVI